jgi:hypothetical protein
MHLEILPGRYAVCRLDPGAVQPIWARAPAGDELLSVTWSDAEMSVVCAEGRVPNGTPAERGFSALRVKGPPHLDLTGVLAALSVPLSEAEVPIFAISTRDTDYLLLRSDDVGRGTAALEAAGHSLEALQEGAGEVLGQSEGAGMVHGTVADDDLPEPALAWDGASASRHPWWPQWGRWRSSA